MLLNKRIARELVAECKNVITFPINIIDINGRIIASSENSRVDTLHTASAELLRSGADEFAIEDDFSYKGCRAGINLPLRVDGQTIGVIGITGALDDVAAFGKVIQKLIEVFLINLQRDNERSEIRQFATVFLSELTQNTGSMTDQFFQEGWERLGCNKPEFFRACCCSISPQPVSSRIADQLDALGSMIRAQLSKTSCIVSMLGDHLCVLAADINSDLLYEYMNNARDIFIQEYKNDAQIAIGPVCHHFSEAAFSYGQARPALTLALKHGVVLYDHHLLDMALLQSVDHMNAFLQSSAFSVLSDKRKLEIATFIDKYIQCNGSISALSEALFIHKNTVQYRISRINTMLNTDIRRLDNLIEIVPLCRWIILLAAESEGPQ